MRGRLRIILAGGALVVLAACASEQGGMIPPQDFNANRRLVEVIKVGDFDCVSPLGTGNVEKRRLEVSLASLWSGSASYERSYEVLKSEFKGMDEKLVTLLADCVQKANEAKAASSKAGSPGEAK